MSLYFPLRSLRPSPFDFTMELQTESPSFQISPKLPNGAFFNEKGDPAKTGFPLKFAMVPLKLFFVGYPRERISSGSGVPKAGFEPARVSPPPPRSTGRKQ